VGAGAGVDTAVPAAGGCAVLGLIAAVDAEGTVSDAVELTLPLKCDHAKKPTATTITAAAAPMKIFLFPPLDSESVVVPPNENDGADPTYADDSLAAGFSTKCSEGLAGAGAGAGT